MQKMSRKCLNCAGNELIDDFIQKSESSDASDTRREFLVEKEEETEEEEEPSVSPVTESWTIAVYGNFSQNLYKTDTEYDKGDLKIIKKIKFEIIPKKKMLTLQTKSDFWRN